jgi:hypothetical protein
MSFAGGWPINAEQPALTGQMRTNFNKTKTYHAIWLTSKSLISANLFRLPLRGAYGFRLSAPDMFVIAVARAPRHLNPAHGIIVLVGAWSLAGEGD